MKILLTGASGLLGRTLKNELENCGENFQVTGTAFSRTTETLVRIDLTDSAAAHRMIAGLKPDLIIHAAAERRPDIVKNDPEKASRINIAATETIAEAAAEYGSSVIYLSTNYVFDGRNPPYRPESPVNPLNDYGRMKLEGERTVGRLCPGSIILRIPILYGDAEYLGESAVTIIAEGISAESPSYFDNRMHRYPTHAGDISRVITGLIVRMRDSGDVSGIYHCSSSRSYTKYEMAKISAGILGTDPGLILESPPDPDAAPRPENARLDTSRLDSLGIGKYREFAPALEKIIRKFQ